MLVQEGNRRALPVGGDGLVDEFGVAMAEIVFDESAHHGHHVSEFSIALGEQLLVHVAQQ